VSDPQLVPHGGLDLLAYGASFALGFVSVPPVALLAASLGALGLMFHQFAVVHPRGLDGIDEAVLILFGGAIRLALCLGLAWAGGHTRLWRDGSEPPPPSEGPPTDLGSWS
jgi:hypothetical protein